MPAVVDDFVAAAPDDDGRTKGADANPGVAAHLDVLQHEVFRLTDEVCEDAGATVVLHHEASRELDAIAAGDPSLAVLVDPAHRTITNDHHSFFSPDAPATVVVNLGARALDHNGDGLAECTVDAVPAVVDDLVAAAPDDDGRTKGADASPGVAVHLDVLQHEIARRLTEVGCHDAVATGGPRDRKTLYRGVARSHLKDVVIGIGGFHSGHITPLYRADGQRRLGHVHVLGVGSRANQDGRPRVGGIHRILYAIEGFLRVFVPHTANVDAATCAALPVPGRVGDGLSVVRHGHREVPEVRLAFLHLREVIDQGERLGCTCWNENRRETEYDGAVVLEIVP